MMETNKHGKSGGSAFLWGLIIGALLATLITNKRGRLILKEIVNLGIELVESFIEERTSKNHESPARNASQRDAGGRIMNQDPGVEAKTNLDQEDIFQASEDLKSEVAQDEASPIADNFDEPIVSKIKSNGNGHHKKRLFRGIRRK